MGGKRDLYINGQWVAAQGKATFAVDNPSTGEVWTHVADASRVDAATAIERPRRRSRSGPRSRIPNERGS